MGSLIVFILLSHKLDESHYQSLSISPNAIKVNQCKVYLEQKKCRKKYIVFVYFAMHTYLRQIPSQYREEHSKVKVNIQEKINHTTNKPTMAFAVQIVVLFLRTWRNFHLYIHHLFRDFHCFSSFSMSSERLHETRNGMCKPEKCSSVAVASIA